MGAVVVPLNPASPGPELTGQIGAVDASTVLVAPAAAPSWKTVAADDVPSVRRVVALDGADVAGALDGRDLLSAPAVPIAEVTEDTLAVLAFTSGTAGSPRAACLTHGNLLANIAQSQATGDRLDASDVVFCVLPLHHIFGLNVVLGITLSVGGTIVLVQRFDPRTALDTIVERKVTVVPGAPPMWVSWAGFDDAPADSFAGVRLALSGASRLPEETAVRMRDRFGVTISEGYGLTEAGPTVTTSAHTSGMGKPMDPKGSVMIFVPMLEVIWKKEWPNHLISTGPEAAA